MQNSINQKLERIHNTKFNRTPKEKIQENDCTMVRNFIVHHKHLLKFVDWTTNTVYLRTDVEQPLYLTDPEAYIDTYEDRTALSLLGDN